MSTIGSPQELKQMTALMPTKLEPFDHHAQRKQQLKSRIQCLKMPDQAFKAINPSITFNLSLEPSFTFTLSIFGDRGAEENNSVHGRTSFKLLDHVLYLESDKKRYELARVSDENQPSKYRLSQVIRPFMKDNEYMKAVRRPLVEDAEVIFSELDWTDL
jgi:hypothetical protein